MTMGSLFLLFVLYLSVTVEAFRPNQPQQLRNRLSTHQMAFNFFSTGSGSLKIPSNKKLCVITGTSSGLGKETAKKLLQTDDYYVICAVRDVDKMRQIAEREGFDKAKHSILELDLGSFDSVRKFVNKLKQSKSKPLDRLVCNAAVYQPALPKVRIFQMILIFSLVTFSSLSRSLPLMALKSSYKSIILVISYSAHSYCLIWPKQRKRE